MERQLHKAKIEHIQKQLAELKNAPCEEVSQKYVILPTFGLICVS